jgi:hypothetical protein
MTYLGDLHISISYMNPNGKQHIGEEMFATPKEKRIEGFYLKVYSNEGYNQIIPYTLLDIEGIKTLARVIDSLLDSDSKVEGAVTSQDIERQANLKRTIEMLELQEQTAKERLPLLRKELHGN